jgi:hypothetical protein
MFPLGFMVYVATYAAVAEHFNYDLRIRANVIAGCVTWAFVGVYWYRIWRPSIPWNVRRMRGTLIAVAVALVAAIILGGMGWSVNDDFGAVIGSITAPLAWLACSVVAWRETDEERAKRLGKIGADEVVCPTCGYSLTGLTESRCPECGTQYTLSELLAGQPGREVNQLR